jgi:hypothetical protein
MLRCRGCANVMQPHAASALLPPHLKQCDRDMTYTYPKNPQYACSTQTKHWTSSRASADAEQRSVSISLNRTAKLARIYRITNADRITDAGCSQATADPVARLYPSIWLSFI